MTGVQTCALPICFPVTIPAIAQAQQAATQAQQEAVSVASNAVSNSLSMNAVSINSQQSSGNGIKVNSNTSNSSNFSLQTGISSINNVGMSPQGSQTSMTVLQQNSSGVGINVLNSQPVVVSSVVPQQTTNVNSVTSVILPLLPPTSQVPSLNVTQPQVVVEQSQQTQQITSQNNNITNQTNEVAMSSPNFLTDKSNPLTDIVEGKQNIPQSTTTTMTGPVVNKNAQDNEVAGGVDINKMAIAPTGYGDYLNFAMRDVAFYAPKEVYKNQRNVDNARALRLLTNDSKHREMVEMQYAK